MSSYLDAEKKAFIKKYTGEDYCPNTWDLKLHQEKIDSKLSSVEKIIKKTLMRRWPLNSALGLSSKELLTKLSKGISINDPNFIEIILEKIIDMEIKMIAGSI